MAEKSKALVKTNRATPPQFDKNSAEPSHATDPAKMEVSATTIDGNNGSSYRSDLANLMGRNSNRPSVAKVAGTIPQLLAVWAGVPGLRTSSRTSSQSIGHPHSVHRSDKLPVRL